MEETKLIFIDIDNTLLDFDEYTKKSLEEGFKKFNIPNYNNNVLETFHRENDILWQRLERKEITLKELRETRFEIIFHKLGIDFDGKTFEKFYSDALYNSAIPIENSLSMLEYLSKKYILAAASNGPYFQQLHRLEIANTKKYFSFFFISEKLGYSKPSKEFFLEAFKEINLDRVDKISPKETIIIGDSLTSDMAGGKNYGIKTCFFDKHKKGIKPDTNFVINDLEQITNIL